jgi:hypothetical protein
MRRRDLDPAACFSRHFCDPTGRARQRFGADRISVDGDARLLAGFRQMPDEGLHRPRKPRTQHGNGGPREV